MLSKSSKDKHIPSALADAEVWLCISVVLGTRSDLDPSSSRQDYSRYGDLQ